MQLQLSSKQPKTAPPILQTLKEKLRKAELKLIPKQQKRRTTLQVKYDNRWKTKSELPEYLSMFFIIYQQDILDAKLKWKDFILKTIQEREKGITKYNSLYIPKNNVC
mgnify:CR=1 FL=1